MTLEQLYEDLEKAFYSGSLETKNVCIELIQQAKSEWCEKQKELLKKAVNLIKGWHNMGIPSNDLAEKTWEIYYNHAPEMKEIREFFNASKP